MSGSSGILGRGGRGNMIDTRRWEPAVTLLQLAHLCNNKQTTKKIGGAAHTERVHWRPSRREFGSRKVVWGGLLQGGRGRCEEGVGELCRVGKGAGRLGASPVGHQPAGHCDGHSNEGQQGGDDQGNYKSYFRHAHLLVPTGPCQGVYARLSSSLNC